MKKSNSEVKTRMTLTDGRGNYMELIGNRESRMSGFSRILEAYCRQIRLAMKESQ